MAVVNTKSALVTNADASALTLNHVTVDGARERSFCATLEVANGDSIGSTLRFGRIKSNARIKSITYFCDGVTSAAMDVGLYQTAANGGAVVDADAYASAVSIATAITAGAEIAFEARNIANIANLVWQDAGLTADPFRDYDIVGTLTAAATAAGTVSVDVTFCVD